MRIIIRGKGSSGFNVVSNNNNYKRLMRNKLQGHGAPDITPTKKGCGQTSPSLEKPSELIIKRTNPKARKYISLNL
jgi:hypothetical protein